MNGPARALFAALATLACCACAKANRLPPPDQVLIRPLSGDSSLGSPAPPPLEVARSRLLATIHGKALGPFLGMSSAGGLIAWIGPAEHGPAQELDVVPLAHDGAPFAEPHPATSVPIDATALVVRPSGGPRGGWFVAWSALLDRGESVSVIALAPDGTPDGSTYDVQRTSDHVKWLDVVPSATGAMCVWAEETTAGDANLLAAPLSLTGKPRGLPVRVARGAIGWAATRDADGVDLAVVNPASNTTATPSNGGPGTLSWIRLDSDGNPRGLPVPIATRPTVSDEVDVVPLGPRGWLLGWTDRTGEDAQVMLATVGPGGNVSAPPRRALDAVGGAVLASLASGPAGVALAWTEPRGRARTMFPVHVASVALEDNLAAQSVTSLELGAAVSTQLVAMDHGFALLSSARECVDGADPCTGSPAPAYVRLDAHLAAVQTEVLFTGKGGPAAALAWGLSCPGDTCVALAADASTPTNVYSVELKTRASPFRNPTIAPVPAGAPRLTRVATIASGQPYADLATARVGSGDGGGGETLLATLTTAVESGDDRARGAPREHATLEVRRIDDNGHALGAASVITSRALPIGGVAMAAGPTPDDGVALAWVARNGGDPQVHLARLDRRGRRANEVELTTRKGGASDVVVDWAGDGWLVAWVDTRDGNGEIYATKVGRDLQRTAREERLTHAPGDAGDLAMVVRGDAAWLAWSDPRESPREGLADIYVAKLRTRDAKRASDDVRVLSTAAHSRSPSIVPAGDGILVAWIEEGPQELGSRGTAIVAYVDGSLHVVGAPQLLPLAEPGSVSELTATRDRDGARIVVARSNKDDVSLDVVFVRGDGRPAPPAWRVLDLDAPGAFDVALSVAGDAIFFDDVGASAADHRVRRAQLAWNR